jgi:diacylglycerol kinase (ATP)
MRRGRADGGTSRPPAYPPGVARTIALLTNPTSGKGRGRRTAAIALPRLTEAGYHVREMIGRDADEALDLARQAVADGVESLAVVGGDGMVHLAVQAVAETETNLGIIPCGTGNDVARYLGLPRTDPQLAADVVVGSRVRRIDLARTGATYFVTVLASGFDSKVNERANAMTWARGQMRYNPATPAELRVFRPLPYVLDLDGEVRTPEAMLVAVGNGESFGGGLRITHGAVLDDGLLDVVVIKPMSKARLLRVYPMLFKGTHVGIPEYEHHRVKAVTVAAPGVVAYADGERVGALPLTIEAVPGALRVLVP